MRGAVPLVIWFAKSLNESRSGGGAKSDARLRFMPCPALASYLASLGRQHGNALTATAVIV